MVTPPPPWATHSGACLLWFSAAGGRRSLAGEAAGRKESSVTGEVQLYHAALGDLSRAGGTRALGRGVNAGSFADLGCEEGGLRALGCRSCSVTVFVPAVPREELLWVHGALLRGAGRAHGALLRGQVSGSTPPPCRPVSQAGPAPCPRKAFPFRGSSVLTGFPRGASASTDRVAAF